MKHVILICSIPFFTGILANAQPVSGSPPQNGGGIYQVGKGVSAPALVFKTVPQYTEEALKAGVQSTVVTSFVVRVDGSTTDIKVIRGAGFGLDESVIEAIRTWRSTRSGRKASLWPFSSTLKRTFAWGTRTTKTRQFG